MDVLIDAHCHGIAGGDLDRASFEMWCTEADRPAPAGTSYMESQVGWAVRRWCAPALGLPHRAPVADYLARRAELGWREVTARLLRAADLVALLVDTGLDAGPNDLDLGTLGELAGAPVHEVVRLERVAEDLAAGGDVAAGEFPEAYRAALAERTAHAVATKSIIAYRYGLAVPPERPSPAEVRDAAGRWLRAGGRLVDPVLLRFVLWCGVDAGLPMQLHTGFGDRDLSLQGADPLLLQPFLAAVEPTGVPIVLLHCYPYHRHAGWLALVYPHVYADVGLTVTHLGVRADAVLGEFFELAPFGKLLFSTDGYALPELYLAGAAQFRHALRRLVNEWVRDGAVSYADAERATGLVCSGNAARLYRL
jgi:predicted TIM-barrel fold metal-dependent hydrolase